MNLNRRDAVSPLLWWLAGLSLNLKRSSRLAANESKIHFGIHIRYIKIHVSWALPWCHTGYISGYIRIVYLGLFITIHQDIPRYKIKIHVSWTLSWTRHYDTSGYNQDTLRYMYLGRFVRAGLDTHKIHAGYTADTFRIRILNSFYLPCCPRSSRRSASSSLESGSTCGALEHALAPLVLGR